MPTESNEPIRLYLDDDREPFKVAHPPLTFQFNTIALPDGPHRLRVEASNGLAPPTVREIPFVVRNGVAITVAGLDPDQTIAGQVQMVINAYAGNTEVDFEPRRAETPQPVPTWAWVVFLAVMAWTMFYLVNPTIKPVDAHTQSVGLVSRALGERIYADTCARCHGEDGAGNRPKVPPLRDATPAVAESPVPLLLKVIASSPGSMMPAWGTRLTNEEIVSVVNHVRHSWGHDGSQIELTRRAPPVIADLNTLYSKAIKRGRVEDLAVCCWPTGKVVPRLFRTDGVDVQGAGAVAAAWDAYFKELAAAGAKVDQISLVDARYDYDPALLDQDGSIVIGSGRVFLKATNRATGEEDVAKGRFIRVYERLEGAWALVFDFADIPMAVGCVPGTVICPPEGLPDLAVAVPTGPPEPTGPEETTAPGEIPTSDLGYDEVVELIKGLNKGAAAAPHENFWELPYDKFVAFSFPEQWGDPGVIRLLIPYDGKHSNLVHALRDGKGIVIDLPGGQKRIRDNVMMPKGAPPMAPADVDRIERWIDAGCPEYAGEPSALPRPGGAATPAPGATDAPADPFGPGGTPPAPGGFPPPGDQPAPGGFPPPGDQPAPGGFPPPGDQPGPGGFPPPGGQPAPGGGFPPPGGDAAPGGGFPPPGGGGPVPGGGPAPGGNGDPAPGGFPPPSR